jgi:hypothetical protein
MGTILFELGRADVSRDVNAWSLGRIKGGIAS